MKWIIHEEHNGMYYTINYETYSHGELLEYIKNKMEGESYEFKVDYEDFVNVRSKTRKIVAKQVRY